MINSLPPFPLKILRKRGLGDEEIRDFFSQDLREIPSFTLIPDMEKAANRIALAIEEKETVGIFGDYDVDGTTSCALFHFFFQWCGLETKKMQPGRFTQGYGIHPPSIEEAKEKEISLLITVDCGITAHAAAKKAEELNLDLIITDHHRQVDDDLPSAYAVVNPNRRDSRNEDLKALAGVGVAFALCVEVRKILMKTRVIPSLYPLLSFVSIGTLCDLAPLNNLNLKLVRHGMKLILENKFAGIASFLQYRAMNDEWDGEYITFEIGPKINSKGRLEHPEASLMLLINEDPAMTKIYYEKLYRCNEERKKVQKEIVTKAQLLFKEKEDEKAVILYQADWHEGVIGIVASKMVESFKRPALIFTNSSTPGIVKSSARSYGSLDLCAHLSQFSHFFEKFGGHAKAAGLSMKKENLPLFKKAFLDSLTQDSSLKDSLISHEESWDEEVELSMISPQFIQQIREMGPFGPMNPKPKFLIKKCRLVDFSILKENHLKCFFVDPEKSISPKVSGIYFNFNDRAGKKEIIPQELLNKDLSLITEIDFNFWKNKKFIQLMIKDLLF